MRKVDLVKYVDSLARQWYADQTKIAVARAIMEYGIHVDRDAWADEDFIKMTVEFICLKFKEKS